jgi:DNA polymerase-3 subunit delta
MTWQARMSADRGMLRAMAADSTSGPVRLIIGPAEFLAERAVAEGFEAAAARDPDYDRTEIMAADLAPGALIELTSPSLFAQVRAVVIRRLSELDEDVHDELVAYAESPADDVVLILVHPGTTKGKRLVDRIRSLRTVDEVRCDEPKPWELARYVSAETRRHGGSITNDAAEFLLAAVGNDLRALSAASHQLVSDFAPQRISIDIVRRYHAGRAEVRSFDIANAAIEGRVADAMEQLRWASGHRVAPVLVTSAFASGLRSLARLQSAPQGLRDGDLARQIGVPTFRLKNLRSQLRSWSPGGLAQAIQAVAAADVSVKGGAGDPDHALERMVLAVAYSRVRR